jgi:hypothetical protein
MDQSRAKIAENAIKNLDTLSKNIKKPASQATAKPSVPTPLLPSGLPTPIAGSGFLRILMYAIAGILLIGIVLLVVDQWITPIFQVSPGSPGYVFMPGSDTSVVFWKTKNTVNNIKIGSLPPPDPSSPTPPPLSTPIIEGQSSYSVTLDVLIKDEFPQNLGPPNGPHKNRTFFSLGPSLRMPSLEFSLDNNTNTVYITSYDTDRLVQTAVIENVPIHTPFRVGVVKTPYLLEGYLNGMLVKTIKLRSNTIDPRTGDTIVSPDNIISGTGDSSILLSKGINALNLRLFSGAVTPAEMKSRMSDLAVIGKSTLNTITGTVAF